MKPKSFIIEFVILLAIYIATRLLVFSLTDSWGDKATFDINFHDTYFVIGRTAIVIPAFFMLATVIYLLKEGFYRYKRKLQNLVLVIANFLFLIVLFPLSALVNMMPNTLYPPQSALPQVTPPADGQNANTLFFIKQITPGLIIIFFADISNNRHVYRQKLEYL